MPLRRKIGLGLLMALSLFTMSASIMKTITAQSNAGGQDIQYNTSAAILWSAVEQCFVIMMGCIPPLATVTKIEFSTLRSIATSLASLVSHRSQSKASTHGKRSGYDSASRSVYQDLEMNSSRKRGTQKDGSLIDDKDAKEPDFTYYNMDGSSPSIANGSKGIQRSDTFAISYD